MEAAKLSRRRDREQTGRYLLEGPNGVAEGLRAGVVEELFVTAEHADDYRDGPVDPTEVSGPVMDKLARTATPPGVLAVARISEGDLAAVVGRGVLVVLDGASDPGNAGTVLRSAHAAGADGVVTTPGTVDLYNPKAVRASAGSIAHVPVVTGVALDELGAACRAAGQRVVGLEPGAGATVWSLEDPPRPVALVLGDEAHGLRGASRTVLDSTVRVPLYGGAESLNLAAAAAVAVYAVARSLHGDTP